MSAFYDQASLVVVPSGYKSGKIYAQKPLTTDGQLSFTRSTGATRVGPDGLIEKVRTNEYFKSTQMAASTLYVPYGASPTSLGTYPVYSDSLAYSIVASGPNQGFAINLSSSSSIRVLSFFSKDFGGVASQSFYYDGTGTLITGYATTEIVNGYTRYYVPIPASTSGLLYSRPNDNNGGTFFITAPQIENGDYPTAYISNDTTASVITVGPVANVPRLDYAPTLGQSGVSCPRLNLEGQRTNLALWSESLSTAPNVVDSSTVTPNAYISPDGYQNADQFTETAANNRHGFYQYTTVTATAYTASIFTKQTGRRYIAFISDMTGTGATSFFDLQTKSVLTSGSGHTCSVQDYGNGWLRLIVSFTAAAGSKFIIWAGSPNGVNTFYAGDTSISQTFWGYQLEAGAYATSYIPTLGAAVTRGADDCTQADVSGLLGTATGSAFIDLVIDGPDTTGNIPLTIGTGTSNLIYMWFKTNTSIVTEFVVGGSLTGALTIPSPFFTYGTRYKVAIAWANNDFVIYVNGVNKGTDTSGAAPTPTKLWLGQYTSGAYKGATINQTLLFPTRLTNAQLAELTTL